MSATLLNLGLDLLNGIMLSVENAETDFYVALFTNSVGAGSNTLAYSDFTLAADSGAMPIQIAGYYWTLPGAADGVSDANGNQPYVWLWDGSPTETYYGYMIYDNNTLIALWYEPFTTPIPNTGGPPALALTINESFGAV